MGANREPAPHADPRRHEAAPAPAASGGAARVLSLQRTIGNRATARLLARDALADAPPRRRLARDGLTGPAPQLTLDPRFMPPSDYRLTTPGLSSPFKRPSYLPPIPDLRTPPPQLWPIPYPDPAHPDPLRPDWRTLVRLMPEPPVTVTVPADPAGAPAKPDDPQATAGAQWSWTAGKAKPDRTVQLQFQQGNLVIQSSVNVDTGAVQWMAGAQPQVSTPEYKVLGAVVSAQAFVQILAGVTVDGGAGGMFTVQAAAGLQLTIKWGPITAQLQAGPQVAWTPKDGWSTAFNFAPAGGPSDPIPGGPALPPMKGWLGWTWRF